MRFASHAALLPIVLAGCVSPPLSTTPGEGEGFPVRLHALGTEPFWSLDVDGADLAYSTADRPAKVTARLSRTESGGLLRLSGQLAGDPITVEIFRTICSDGMSDRIYPFTAAVRIGPTVLRGCASASSTS